MVSAVWNRWVGLSLMREQVVPGVAGNGYGDL